MSDPSKSGNKPTREEINEQAARYQPALSKRQAQVLTALAHGYDVEGMVELFDWGHTTWSPSEHGINQALNPAIDKYSAAIRLVEDFAEVDIDG